MESVAAQGIVFGGAVVAFFLWSWWPLIAGILVDAAVMMLLYRHTPLTVVTSGQRFRWRVGAMIGVAVFIALVILAGVADRV